MSHEAHERIHGNTYLCFVYIYIIALVIGWLAEEYTVTEGQDREAVVCVGLLEGFLALLIPAITVTTRDGTALSTLGNSSSVKLKATMTV